MQTTTKPKKLIKTTPTNKGFQNITKTKAKMGTTTTKKTSIHVFNFTTIRVHHKKKQYQHKPHQTQYRDHTTNDHITEHHNKIKPLKPRGPQKLNTNRQTFPHNSTTNKPHTNTQNYPHTTTTQINKTTLLKGMHKLNPKLYGPHPQTNPTNKITYLKTKATSMFLGRSIVTLHAPSQTTTPS